MSKNYINHIGTYNDNSKSITINGAGVNVNDLVRSFMTEDVEPVEEVKDSVNSIIFTKKTQKEARETSIIEALQKSVIGRKDKTRAFVDELKSWQEEGYIDAHYNAKIMYDELEKLTPLTFGYDTFRKYYNNLI